MNAADLEHISGILRAAVIRVAEGLPRDVVQNVWDLIDAAEPGVALETLCSQLYEYDVAVPPEVVDQLAVAGESMGLAPSFWKILRN